MDENGQKEMKAGQRERKWIKADMQNVGILWVKTGIR